MNYGFGGNSCSSLPLNIHFLSSDTHTHTPRHTQSNTEAKKRRLAAKKQTPLQTDDFMHPSSGRKNQPSANGAISWSGVCLLLHKSRGGKNKHTHTKKTLQMLLIRRHLIAANIWGTFTFSANERKHFKCSAVDGRGACEQGFLRPEWLMSKQWCSPDVLLFKGRLLRDKDPCTCAISHHFGTFTSV